MIKENKKLTDGVTRYAIIFEYKGIKIANLHLDGGGYIDRTLYYLRRFISALRKKKYY